MKEKKGVLERQDFDSGKVIEDGVEWPETTPVELPIGYSHPPSIQEMLRVMVQHELQMRDEMGDDRDESEREEDFNVDDDDEELLTPYELHHAAAEETKILESRGLTRNKKSGRIEERGNKATEKGDSDGTEQSGIKDGGKRFGSGGEKRAAVGGKGRATGSSSDGVSQVQRGGGRVAEESSGGTGEVGEAASEEL